MYRYLDAEICGGCSKYRHIVNRKYGLCALCNHKRLNPDPTPRKTPKPRQPLKKPRKPAARQTEKKKARELALNNAKFLITATRRAVCSGCGRTGNLSFSHIIAVSRRPDLEPEPQNIVYDCLTTGRINPRGKNENDLRGCHEIWENGTKEDRQRLLNYAERLKIIKELDPQYYSLLQLKNRI